MPCIFLPSKRLRRAPIESWLKLILGGIGLAGEVITGIHWYADPVVSNPATADDAGHDHMHMEGHDHGHMHKRDAGHEHNLQPDVAVKTFHFEYVNSQHITMYSAFILGAIVEIMAYHRFQMPRQLPYALGIFAFGIEGFLFANHLHSRHALDIHVHVLLVYAIYGCVICSILEAYNNYEIIFAYGRILFTILQGTWFFQVGFILYPPNKEHPFFKWEKDNHNHIMLITGSFCWHIMFIIIGLILQLVFIKRFYVHSRKARGYFDILQEIDEELQLEDDGDYLSKVTGGVHSGGRDGKYFTLVSDDDEDVQFDSSKLLIKEQKDDIKLQDYKEYKDSSSGSSATSGVHSVNLI